MADQYTLSAPIAKLAAFFVAPGTGWYAVSWQDSNVNSRYAVYRSQNTERDPSEAVHVELDTIMLAHSWEDSAGTSDVTALTGANARYRVEVWLRRGDRIEFGNNEGSAAPTDAGVEFLGSQVVPLRAGVYRNVL